jgi:type I restriction enzyme S subunit
MTSQVKSVDGEYKKTELGNIPIDWTIKSIGEICEILDSKRKPLNKAQRVEMKGNIPYYGANGIVDYVNDYLFHEELILMAEDGGNFAEYETRPIAYKIEGHSWVNNHAHVLKPKKNYILDWIYYSVVNKNIIPFISGGTRAKLNQADLKKILIPIPPLKEQQKISEILTAADKQIEKTEQLIEKTSELKKALMQQLFTAGTGHSEFKDTIMGKIPASWKLTILEDISKFITKGSTPTTYGFDWQDQGIFFFKSDVVKNGKFVYGDFKYIDENAHQHMLRSQVQAGDILMTITGNIGRVALVPEEIKRANINQHVARISVKNPEFNSLFVFYWLSQSKFIEYYNSIKTGLAYPQISLKQVRETIVPIPSMEEQKKIAEILTSVDEQIDTYEKEKKKQIELKKALMQQLLTGNIRVTV